ncbi:MAG: hypothetical protein JO359_09205, partial [Candidatus Eremiobacteraeota bacterium]|nr:hypothetical protein [Candidatus Eremiobacteraeota bacterium]
MRLGWAALAFVVVLAGCGGGGGGGGTGPPSQGGSSTPTPTPTVPIATPSPTPTASPIASGAAAPSVGYLTGNGSTFSGTTSASASSVTLTPISEIFKVQAFPPSFVTASVRVDVSGATQSLARKSVVDAQANTQTAVQPRVGLSADRFAAVAPMRSLASALRRAPQTTSTAAPSPTGAPAARSFAVLSGGTGPSSTSYVQVAATLQQTSAHAYVYVDNSLGLSTSTVGAIASDFENAYLSDTTHFGTSDYPSNAPFGPLNGTAHPCDAGGNQIPGAQAIPVVIPDTDGRTYVVVVSQSNAGNGEGGYFDPANYFAQSFANCSLKV